MAFHQIQTIVKDASGREIMGFARTRRPKTDEEVLEIHIASPGGQRSWVMTAGEAQDIRQQLAKALHHLAARKRDKKKAPSQHELMDVT